jgi:Ras-related protein Rab-1A
MDNSRVLRTVVIGGQATGKSALSARIAGEEPSKEYVGTIGVDYVVRRFSNEDFVVHLWDISGAERFESIIKTYIPKGKLVLIVYALNDTASLQHARKLYWKYTREDMFLADKIIVVANKVDVASWDELQKQGEKFAEQIKAEHVAVSAKTKEGLGHLISRMISILPPVPLPVKECVLDTKGWKNYCSLL